MHKNNIWTNMWTEWPPDLDKGVNCTKAQSAGIWRLRSSDTRMFPTHSSTQRSLSWQRDSRKRRMQGMAAGTDKSLTCSHPVSSVLWWKCNTFLVHLSQTSAWHQANLKYRKTCGSQILIVQKRVALDTLNRSGQIVGRVGPKHCHNMVAHGDTGWHWNETFERTYVMPKSCVSAASGTCFGFNMIFWTDPTRTMHGAGHCQMLPSRLSFRPTWTSELLLVGASAAFKSKMCSSEVVWLSSIIRRVHRRSPCVYVAAASSGWAGKGGTPPCTTLMKGFALPSTPVGTDI